MEDYTISNIRFFEWLLYKISLYLHRRSKGEGLLTGLNHNSLHSKEAYWNWRNIEAQKYAKRIKSHISFNNKTVLDFGCGDGGLTTSLYGTLKPLKLVAVDSIQS